MSARDLDLQLDAAYQPLLAVEADLRKRGHLGDDEATRLSEQVWGVVLDLQRIKAALEAIS